ncbi:hypothetical protein FXO37_35400 [Capsicum annuum]|nr:hypothetical protein FXO37_35400 [Capsicum annuum]
MDLSTSSSSFSSASSSSSWFSGIVRGRSNSVKMSNKNPAAASGGADSVSGGGPITTKKQFLGVMFKYGPKSVQVVTGLRLQVMESATCRNAGIFWFHEKDSSFEFLGGIRSFMGKWLDYTSYLTFQFQRLIRTYEDWTVSVPGYKMFQIVTKLKFLKQDLEKLNSQHLRNIVPVVEEYRKAL